MTRPERWMPCGCAEDSVEIALDFFKSVGAYLQDVNLGGYNM